MRNPPKLHVVDDSDEPAPAVTAPSLTAAELERLARDGAEVDAADLFRRLEAIGAEADAMFARTLLGAGTREALRNTATSAKHLVAAWKSATGAR